MLPSTRLLTGGREKNLESHVICRAPVTCMKFSTSTFSWRLCILRTSLPAILLESVLIFIGPRKNIRASDKIGSVFGGRIVNLKSPSVFSMIPRGYHKNLFKKLSIFRQCNTLGRDRYWIGPTSALPHASSLELGPPQLQLIQALILVMPVTVGVVNLHVVPRF